MSVLLDHTSLKDKVAALQKQVDGLKSEVRRLQTRLTALERRQGVSRAKHTAAGLGFAADGHAEDGGEDVQCVVS